jgi:23S rRNA (pseudouridine1915-N3)-methyltransferase
MRLRVVVVGDDRNDPFRLAADDYLQRVRRPLGAGLICVKEGKRNKGANDGAIRSTEGRALLEASAGTFRVALDAEGKTHTSEAFAERLGKWVAAGRPVAFLIGGATGLSSEVKAEADHLLSLSPLTMPHRLALAVLCEQLYRATEIWRGGPYHK